MDMTIAIGAGVVGLVLYWILKPDPEPHLGVYRQRGRWYWLKRAVFAIMFHMRARRSRQSKDRVTGREGVNQISRVMESSMNPYDMEGYHRLHDHPHAIDCVYFGAFSSGEGPNIAMRIGLRHGRKAEIWLVLQIPGVGILQHPVHPDTLITNTHPKSYSAGGLHFDVVHPMKTWRVRYSGQLRVGPCNSIDDKPAEFLDTTFSFQWDAFGPHCNLISDLDPSFVADAIAREKWSKGHFEKHRSYHQVRYEQWGELKGTLSVEGHPTQQLRLKSVRDHSFGLRKWTDFHRYIYCMLYIETGLTLQIGVVSQPEIYSHLRTGYLTYPTGEKASLTAVNMNLWEVGEKELQPPAQWRVTFIADGNHYELKVKTKMSAILYKETDRGGVVHETFCDVTLNGREGWGLSEFFYRNTSRSEVQLEPILPLLDEPEWEEVKDSQDELYLPFTSPACCSSALVGGKGSQLALLTHMSQWESTVSVPPGLCVTLKAFERQMEENSKLQETVNKVANTAINDPGKLEGVCREASDLLSQTPVCSAVRNAVGEGLSQLFGNELQLKRVAVRSSASGEDGSEASSAGQMETYLGVRGEEEICKSLQKCWASAFSYQAVEYRRQHGQPILTSVGVVIQEMVPAEAAGVLFTVDPVTNNASVISINANFGLGESVVSGKCEPDTIAVRREWDGSLTIVQRQAGHKKTKITMKDEGGTSEVELSSGDGDQYCLTDDVILSLSHVGIQTEKYFGSPRDIEWAYADGTIYLLQARPITTSEKESEEDLIHEFDSPLAGGYEYLTTGNISEMMPGAVTPLTLSTFALAIDNSMQRFSHGYGARQQVVNFSKAVTSCGNNLFISLTDIYLGIVEVALFEKNAMELNLLGETRPDLDIATAYDYIGRPPSSLLRRIWNSVSLLRRIRNSGESEYWEKRLEGYSLGGGCETASELYADMERQLPDLLDAWYSSLVTSSKSGFWSSLPLRIITQNYTTGKVEQYGDIALLLSQCQNVYSAEVPSALQDLAKQIADDGLKEMFCSSSDEECLNLLKNDKYPVLQQKTRTFFQRHGHRCLREAEMREKSWQLDPSRLTSVLKRVLETGAYNKPVKKLKTAKQLVSEIKTPLPFLTRKILQYLLPKVWAAVGSREWGKSIAVKMNDVFKTAYWKLAALMVKEGRLPDEDLVFFLTHYEIGHLLSTRSARLVMKAQRRRKILNKQMALRFPKVSTGYPIPVETKKADNKSDVASCLQGMPVSQGVVEGPARIVLSLADAHTIQAGDVLVVTCTDVGWTPYFPLVAGLVTEIGGLISHGAVVAREYGIPCVVSIPDATVKIRNGAQLELDGRAGTVKILS